MFENFKIFVCLFHHFSRNPWQVFEELWSARVVTIVTQQQNTRYSRACWFHARAHPRVELDKVAAQQADVRYRTLV